MLFRIDIGEKLDLSKIRKHAQVYIGSMRELTYDIFLQDYKIVVQVNQVDDKSVRLITIVISEKVRVGGDIVRYQPLIPSTDNRFQDSKLIHSLFQDGSVQAALECSNTQETADQICQLIKLIHKINNLKAFL